MSEKPIPDSCADPSCCRSVLVSAFRSFACSSGVSARDGRPAGFGLTGFRFRAIRDLMNHACGLRKSLGDTVR
jgi:hypothetical protein